MEQPIPWLLLIQHPMIILGSVLLLVAIFLASSGRFGKKDPALIYTFIAAIAIILMGFISSLTNMRMAKMTQPAAFEQAVNPSTAPR